VGYLATAGTIRSLGGRFNFGNVILAFENELAQRAGLGHFDICTARLPRNSKHRIALLEKSMSDRILILRELLGFMRIPTRLADYRPRKPFADHSEMPLLKYGQSVLLHGSKVSGDRLF